MTISEKVAYLKGLAEGLDLDTSKSKEAKLISVMIGILEEIGMSIEDLEENTVALGEELDAVSDDLSDVEKAVFEDEDEDDDCCCDEDDDFFEVECPNCGETLVIDEDVLEEGAIPSTTERLRCPYRWYYPNDPTRSHINCAGGDHGRLNVTEAITKSCNYFFAVEKSKLSLWRCIRFE